MRSGDKVIKYRQGPWSRASTYVDTRTTILLGGVLAEYRLNARKSSAISGISGEKEKPPLHMPAVMLSDASKGKVIPHCDCHGDCDWWPEPGISVKSPNAKVNLSHSSELMGMDMNMEMAVEFIIIERTQSTYTTSSSKVIT